MFTEEQTNNGYNPGDNGKEMSDFQLHEKAGLTYSGKDYNGYDEWIGSREEWNEYDRLSNITE